MVGPILQCHRNVLCLQVGLQIRTVSYPQHGTFFHERLTALHKCTRQVIHEDRISPEPAYPFSPDVFQVEQVLSEVFLQVHIQGTDSE